MDEGYDRERSPVERRDDYRGTKDDSRAAAPVRRARSRSRSRSPTSTRRPRSSSRDRSRRSYRRSSRSRSRSRERRPRDDDRDGGRRRRGDSPGYSSRRRDDDSLYPHSSTRGGFGGGPSRGGFRGGRGGPSSRGPPFDSSARSSHREALAQEAIKSSKKENRVYVGNLSFQVRWHDLKDFCSSVGTVVFAEIITLPNGMSKGCGIVEFGTRDEAMRAISELNEGQLMGRPVFLREDREDDARFGQAAVSSRQTFPGAAQQGTAMGGPRGGGRPAPGLAVPAVFAPPGPRGLYVTGMSDVIGWQDLKDLFRAAGNVLRADINIDHTTGQSKGTGVVVMDSKSEAEAAIAMFNGYEFDGGKLDVREDRFYHINAARGAHGGSRGRGSSRGGFGGGHASSYSSSRNTDNLYGDYAGPEGSPGAGMDGDGFGARGGFAGGRGGFGPPGARAALAGGRAFEPRPAVPSTQIFVQNLPWSTSNEDLVELFQTTGTVEHAEVLWQDGRSKGNGVVQFASIEEAETAIAKFQGYQYGGRPLGLAFNARWKEFGEGQNGHGEGNALPVQVGDEMQQDPSLDRADGERMADGE